MEDFFTSFEWQDMEDGSQIKKKIENPCTWASINNLGLRTQVICETRAFFALGFRPIKDHDVLWCDPLLCSLKLHHWKYNLFKSN